MNFSMRLVHVCSLDGRSLAEIERVCGLTRGALTRFRKGSSLPSVESLVGLSRGLHVNIHWLLTGDGSMRPPGVDRHAATSDELEMALAKLRVISALADGLVHTDLVRAVSVLTEESVRDETRRIAKEGIAVLSSRKETEERISDGDNIVSSGAGD